LAEEKMSRKNWYFTILITAIIIIAAGFILHIPLITKTVHSLAKMIIDWRVAVPAIICALVFTKHKSYWVMLLICAVVVAVAIQAYFYHLGSVRPVVLRTAAFLIVAYAVDYLRVVLRR